MQNPLVGRVAVGLPRQPIYFSFIIEKRPDNELFFGTVGIWPALLMSTASSAGDSNYLMIWISSPKLPAMLRLTQLMPTEL